MKMTYQYDVNAVKNDKTSSIGLSLSHCLHSIIDIFVSSFLIAYIYTLTNGMYDYIFKVAVYQISLYVGLLVFYHIFSAVLDKTNRVLLYRIGCAVKSCLVIFLVFFGKNLAEMVVLAGVLNGIASAGYYSGYNVLRQEMVSRKKIKSYITYLTAILQAINIVFPIVIGTLIDISTYSMVAIYILVLSVIQVGVTFLIKAKRPKDSSYSIKAYLKRLNKNEHLKRKMKKVYISTFMYGFNALIGTITSVCIMLQFGTNFSLGAVTSVVAVVQIVVLLLFNKFTVEGKRLPVFIISAILPIVGVLLFVFMPNYVMLVLFNVMNSIASVIFTNVFDVMRNRDLKENNMYDDIAEHQVVGETFLDVARIISYILFLVVGLIQNLIAFYVVLIISVLVFVANIIFVAIYEKKYKEDYNKK